MPKPTFAPEAPTWTSSATGQTASRPGAGYWVGLARRGDRFKVSVAYDETIVGHYAVPSEGEATFIHHRLLTPAGGRRVDPPAVARASQPSPIRWVA
jgi:hypothetical protein